MLIGLRAHHQKSGRGHTPNDSDPEPPVTWWAFSPWSAECEANRRDCRDKTRLDD